MSRNYSRFYYISQKEPKQLKAKLIICDLKTINKRKMQVLKRDLSTLDYQHRDKNTTLEK